MLALIVGACGGDAQRDEPASRDGAPTRAVNAVLSSTFGERGSPPDRGRVMLSLRVRGDGVPALRGPLSVRLSGPFDLSGRRSVPRFDISTVVRADGKPAHRSGAVSTGSAGFIRARGRAYRLPAALYAGVRGALLGPDGRAGRATFRSLGIDPRRWLLDARRGPVERLDGGRAIHVEGQLNVPRMLDDVDTLLGQASRVGMLLPGSPLGNLSESARERIVADVRRSSVDIWTGEDDRVLRRLDVDVDLDDGDALELRLRIRDVHEPQVIRPPATARPLGDLLGGPLAELMRSVGTPTPADP